MGVIFLALISYGAAKSGDGTPPVWVIFSCALAIAWALTSAAGG